MTSSSREHDPTRSISRNKRTISVITVRSLATDCTESSRLRFLKRGEELRRKEMAKSRGRGEGEAEEEKHNRWSLSKAYGRTRKNEESRAGDREEEATRREIAF